MENRQRTVQAGGLRWVFTFAVVASCLRLAACQGTMIAKTDCELLSASPKMATFLGLPDTCPTKFLCKSAHCNSAFITTNNKGQVTNLTVHNQDFDESLPEAWSNLTTLVELQLWGDHFTGTLPASWAALTNLEKLQIWRNNYTGTLPVEWSVLTGLKELGLWKSQLSGTLPKEWAALTGLKFLALWGNSFTSTLPAEWSTLVNLERIFLDFNNFTGTIPEEWSAWTNLVTLPLNDSGLCGRIPNGTLLEAAWATKNNSLAFGNFSLGPCNNTFSWNGTEYPINVTNPPSIVGPIPKAHSGLVATQPSSLLVIVATCLVVLASVMWA